MLSGTSVLVWWLGTTGCALPEPPAEDGRKAARRDRDEDEGRRGAERSRDRDDAGSKAQTTERDHDGNDGRRGRRDGRKGKREDDRDAGGKGARKGDDGNRDRGGAKSIDGRFRRAPEVGEDRMAALEAIGYLSGSTEGTGLSGVVVHDPERAMPGYNLVVSGHGPVVHLIDMAGESVHRWRLDFATAFPDREVDADEDHRTTNFRRAYLQPDGDLIVIWGGIGIARIDRDSELVWSNPVLAHHDAHLADGQLWTLTRRASMIERIHRKEPILEDFITLIDPETGETGRSTSLLRAVERSEWAEPLLRKPKRDGGDIFHTNSIEVLDGRLADAHPAFEAGRVLVSLRNVHAVLVVDPLTEEAVWAHKGTYHGQHDARSLDNGRFLLFDNLGAEPSSRILEIDPATGEETVVYEGTEEAPFFSRFCGTSTYLDNGNLLVSETDRGRAFEVTPDGDIVWELHNPHRAGDDDEFVAALFEVVRVPEADVEGWR